MIGVINIIYNDKKSLYELDIFYHSDIRHYDDCLRLQQILFNRAIQLTLLEVQELWENHSEGYCAGWECLSDDIESDDYLFDILLYELKRYIDDKGNRILEINDSLERNGML